MLGGGEDAASCEEIACPGRGEAPTRAGGKPAGYGAVGWSAAARGATRV
jgi:hypothetical protein